ncbi:CAP domain-containing protein [Niallia sp. 01092]|uniref:CAP domain-containing protein n=1 Tax=unclassified Niallia TaxID=2837522 RepID=UPI003FD3B77F
MKKRNMILSAAAATALLMSSPMVNKASAAECQPAANQVKVESKQLNQEQINTILNKYKTSNAIDINKVLAELQNSQQAPAKAAAPVKKEETPKNNTAAPAKKEEAPKNNAAAPVKKEEAPKNNAAAPVKKEEAPKNNAAAPANAPAPAASKPASETTAATEVSAFEKEVVELTNKERAKNGLPALQLDTELSKVAKAKSQDMSTNNYFDHNSPTYGSPFDMMKKFGISYKAAGENIAKGQKTPEEVVQAWMNSEGHRANILSNKFTHIGVGYVENGNYWTQQFIGK